jgi:preprotein translocase subunit SecE
VRRLRRATACKEEEDVLVDSDDAPDDRTDGDGRDDQLVGASVPAGSARAAARASGARSGVTPSKGRPTPSRQGGRKRPNIFVRVVHYLREVIAELRKVIWPTQNEMVTYSIVVILFLIFMVGATWGADWIFAKGVLALFG